MQYLALENISKSYGEKILLNKVNITISKGDKIALIAKNGSGKTTLMRIIAGEESPEGEQAKVFVAKNIRTSFLHQDPKLDDNATVLDVIFQTEKDTIIAVRKYEEALISQDPQLMEAATMAMDDHQAWDVEANVKKILASLRIDYLDQKIGTLSGGQKKRVALAQVIIEEPDFIILDEPTNHLDIDMIEWLEDHLHQANVTLFMVTHDRYFLENVCNEMIELDRGNLHIYKGNYSQYLEKRAARLENEDVVFDKTKKLFKKELEWVRRMPQARSTKAKSRVDSFYTIKESLKNQRTEEEMSLVVEPQRLGSKIVELHNISKAYGSKNLIESFSYKFKKGERLGVVGVNGAGKSTLVSMMTERVPTDTGKVVVGETVAFGYYDQRGLDMTNDKMVIDVVRDIAEYLPLAKGQKLSAESLLERFLFTRSQQRVLISQLSGGEKRRLYLLTVLMKNPNFLILDEPTNDLDIITLNVLEDYLQDYQGCLVIITHDRYFMDKLVDHIFVLEGDGKVKDFNGSYSEYRDAKQAEHESAVATPIVVESKTDSKLEFEWRKEIKNVEKQIERLQDQKTKLSLKFEDPTLSPDNIAKLSKELQTIDQEIEEKEVRWMELVDLLE